MKFTPTVLDAFRQMQRLEGDPAAEDGWWEYHEILSLEMRIPPWQFPAIEKPGYPRYGNPDPAAQALYAELERAITLS